MQVNAVTDPNPKDPDAACSTPASSDGSPEAAQATVELGRADEFKRLDERTISFWRLTSAATWTIVALVALSVGAPLLWHLSVLWKLMGLLGYLLVSAVGALNIIYWPRWSYDRWSYHLGQNVFQLRHGVVWHVTVAIPLARLQHVDLHRGPVESRWGLATLELHTAGTRDASHRIPGLDATVADELRDRLIDAANQETDERNSDQDRD